MSDTSNYSRALTLAEQTFFDLYESAETPQQIGAIYLLDRPLDASWLRDHVRQLADTFPRLRYRVDYATSAWQCDPEFAAEQHFGVAETDDVAKLLPAAGALVSQSLSRVHPPWQATLLTTRRSVEIGNDASASPAALLWRWHHGLVDGIGAPAVLDTIGDTSVREHDERPANANPLRVGYLPVWRRIWSELWQTAPRSPISGRNSSARRYDFLEFPRDPLRQAGRAAALPFTPACLAVVAGGLRKHFEQYGVVPHDVIALTPFSSRRRSEKFALGNKFIPINLRLPLSVSDVRQRFKTIVERWEQLTTPVAEVAFNTGLRAIGALPKSWRRALSLRSARNTNLICTVLPGFAHHQTIGGAAIVAKYGVPTLAPSHGLAVAVVTYRHKLYMTIVSDPAIVPAGESIARSMRESFDELVTACGCSVPNAPAVPNVSSC